MRSPILFYNPMHFISVTYYQYTRKKSCLVIYVRESQEVKERTAPAPHLNAFRLRAEIARFRIWPLRVMREKWSNLIKKQLYFFILWFSRVQVFSKYGSVFDQNTWVRIRKFWWRVLLCPGGGLRGSWGEHTPRWRPYVQQRQGGRGIRGRRYITVGLPDSGDNNNNFWQNWRFKI